MIKRLQKRYALSEQGAKDLVKGCLACVLQNLSFMFPVGLLYFLVCASPVNHLLSRFSAAYANVA